MAGSKGSNWGTQRKKEEMGQTENKKKSKSD